MRASGLRLVGLAALLAFGCQIDVDEYCGDDEEWDDDDEHCEIHSDTTTTVSGSGGTGGTSSDGDSSVSTYGATVTTVGSTSGGTGYGVGGSSDTGSTSAGDSASAGGSGGASGATSSTDGSSSTATTTDGAPCASCGDPPPQSTCLWGSATMEACCTADVLVDVAAQDCAGLELDLADFVLEQACDGGHLSVSYQCCKDPVEACSVRSAALETCVSTDILMALAEQWCAETGRSVAEFVPSEACEDGSYRGLSATCCAAE